MRRRSRPNVSKCPQHDTHFCKSGYHVVRSLTAFLLRFSKSKPNMIPRYPPPHVPVKKLKNVAMQSLKSIALFDPDTALSAGGIPSHIASPRATHFFSGA